MPTPTDLGRDIARKVQHRYRRVTRRRRRNVLVTDIKALGFGNALYLWLHAEKMRAEGIDYWVMIEQKDIWLEAFPSLRDLSLTWEDIDRRSDYCEANETPRLYQRFGIDFTASDLAAFIDKHLAPHLTPTDATVVNVRRGDYYYSSSSRLSDRYAMDTLAFLTEALPLAGVDGGPIRVVSDDPAWCQKHLHNLLSSHGEPSYAPADDPLGNFTEVCSARRLIGSNSTFSYWGGYVSSRFQDATVVMPAFHARGLNGGYADQLDFAWTAIDNVSDLT